MSGITILSADAGLEAKLSGFYGRQMAIRRVWSDQWRDSSEMSMDACAATPELLVIGPKIQRDVVRYVVADVDRRYRSTTTVVLAHEPSTETILDLLRLGARDVLEAAVDDVELRAKLDPIVELAQDRHQSTVAPVSSRRRRVITVLSPKGGTGKTTVSSNLAVALAVRHPQKVLLLDLDLQFGDCATILGLKPEHSLVHVLKAGHHDRSALKVFLTTHDSGLLLLPPPDDLVSTDTVDGDNLKRVLGALTEEFPHVVIDTSAGIDPTALAAMEVATDFLFVTTTDVPSILAVKRQIEALDAIGYTSQRRTLLVNRSGAKVGLSVEDAQAAIGLEAQFEIPSSRVVPVATNEGIALHEKDPNGLGRRFDEVAEFYAPSADGNGGRSFLGSLRKGR